MLQNALVVEIIVAIFSLVLLGLGCYFFTKGEEKDSKFYIVSAIFFIATGIGALYFLYHIFAFTQWSFGTGVVALIKVLIPFIIGSEIILYATDYIDEAEVQGLTIFCVSLCVLLVIGGGGLIANFVQEEKYNEKVIQIEEQRYSEEKYELVDKFNTTKVENADINVSTSPYFNFNIKELPEDWTCDKCGYSDCEHKPESIKIYEIYYISNKECLYKEIDEKLVEFAPLKENEKPYLLVKKYTSYAIDNNQDPPVECNVKDTYVYELHVSAADIQKANKKQ